MREKGETNKANSIETLSDQLNPNLQAKIRANKLKKRKIKLDSEEEKNLNEKNISMQSPEIESLAQPIIPESDIAEPVTENKNFFCAKCEQMWKELVGRESIQKNKLKLSTLKDFIQFSFIQEITFFRNELENKRIQEKSKFEKTLTCLQKINKEENPFFNQDSKKFSPQKFLKLVENLTEKSIDKKKEPKSNNSEIENQSSNEASSNQNSDSSLLSSQFLKNKFQRVSLYNEFSEIFTIQGLITESQIVLGLMLSLLDFSSQISLQKMGLRLVELIRMLFSVGLRLGLHLTRTDKTNFLQVFGNFSVQEEKWLKIRKERKRDSSILTVIFFFILFIII